MSKIDYQALRERYSPKPVPECHICGKEMTIQHMSASRITYGCTGEGNDGYFKFGRTFADEHYEKSRVTVVDVSDPDVLELLDELETKEEQRANWFQMAQKLGEDLDAAEKHMAGLEAKLANPVLLPKTNGYWNEQEKAYEEAITLARRQIRLAGFRCEGDE
ncbi:ead/Ea22-like family protein [Salmonella enterica]|uniref:Ead/Ea22-like family protein n=2 Tax=Salmonella enterica TaxID=28901 RepID=A0A760MM06_SALER|nr:ead/Ea22-like family protein [Salmonella enterica]ECR6163281.1 ead/Ea22-like family protein [Salmonella enterica subsp. enterica serovar Muenchen]EDU7664505.1 ead/Ea22-like family protein [Salmonella enterica subsp. enterica serovar Glostrup]EHC9818095.1 ead/Ea22-like family protein [Salmonella enterica subsp. enterica serovar Newport]EAO9929236.1 ead/Ea22-like family protein [Salmonella enterica]